MLTRAPRSLGGAAARLEGMHERGARSRPKVETRPAIPPERASRQPGGRERPTATPQRTSAADRIPRDGSRASGARRESGTRERYESTRAGERHSRRVALPGVSSSMRASWNACRPDAVPAPGARDSRRPHRRVQRASSEVQSSSRGVAGAGYNRYQQALEGKIIIIASLLQY